ncbi:MAG TPA: CRISPR-associated protein Cas4 [Fimbriimonadaceae bacterium]|nr:CRISPR-associated protein Cas4 [Fimbriimonadaceae bacterium]HRJ96817.1 CRISPR-associated protein Cas4 [Fimbriimonadaceae bacterium]
MRGADGTNIVEPVPISAIEHWSYCPRQCGLIHLESIWDENLFTLRGTKAHRRVDEDQDRVERGRRVLRGLPIWSERYGLVGKADVVELLPAEPPYREAIPVEYKVGRRTDKPHALLQACAQAICLEEMFGLEVRQADVFFVESRERVSHELTADLREQTLAIVEAIRAMMAGPRPPPPVADRRCRKCSLIDACQPFAVERGMGQPEARLYEPLPLGELP